MNVPQIPPDQLQRAWQCAAICDAAITSEDWVRVFWYEPNWADGIAMAKYDNGAGDSVVAFFTVDGNTVIKGFDHESEVSPYAREEYEAWPGIYDGMPSNLWDPMSDEAAEYEHVTFCCWSIDGESWKTGSAIIPDDIDDGSEWLLEMIQMNAEQFIDWAKSYYEKDFDRIGESGILTVFKNNASLL
jgi:hypothetical protein